MKLLAYENISLFFEAETVQIYTHDIAIIDDFSGESAMLTSVDSLGILLSGVKLTCFPIQLPVLASGCLR